MGNGWKWQADRGLPVVKRQWPTGRAQQPRTVIPPCPPPPPPAYSQTLGIQARATSTLMARASAATRSACLRRLAQLLRDNTAPLQPENLKDLTRATAAGLAAPMVDRLKLTPRIIDTVALGCEQLAAMPDVIGEISGTCASSPAASGWGRCGCRSACLPWCSRAART